MNKAELAAAPSPAATEPDPPTGAEAARLLGRRGLPTGLGLLLWLTMVTGSRRGEISALRWHHVDLAGALLTLQRSNAQPKSGLKEKTIKTRQQRRVTIDPQTVGLLTAHRQACEQRCAALGVELGPAACLFSPAPDGSIPWPPRSLTLRYGRLARKLQLRSTRLHSLRHYSATELIAAGTDVRTVAGRLGHGSGGATTLKVYAAWVDEAGQRAVNTMAEIAAEPERTSHAHAESRAFASGCVSTRRSLTHDLDRQPQDLGGSVNQAAGEPAVGEGVTARS